MRALSFSLAASSAAVVVSLSPVVHAQETPVPAAQPPAAAPATPVTPPVTPPVTVTGVVEVNYTLNFNRPFNNSNTYLYNTNEGQLSLNLADVRIARAATPTSRVGFFVRPIAGEVARRNFNAGDVNNPDGNSLRVLEAYATLLVPVHGRDLKVDAGQFVTHVGYETIDIGTNNFFSRNFLFQYPSPFYNAGLRAALPLSDKLTVTGFILNRFNGTYDPGNRDLAPGFQIAYNPSPATSLYLNGLTSRDNTLYDGTASTAVLNKQQSIIDVIASHQFGASFKGVFEGLYRYGKDSSDSSYNVPGVALYGIYTLKNGNVLGLRAETLRQSTAQSGVIAPYPGTVVDTPVLTDTLARSRQVTLPSVLPSSGKPRLSSVTASYELHSGLFAGSRTFLEYRYDFAGDRFFAGHDADTYTKNQSTVTIGQVVTF